MPKRTKKVVQQKENQKELIQAVSSWSGPLPPPQILERFENVVPGSAKKIMDAFEEQGQHRISIEKRVINSDTKNERLGMIFAFIIVMTMLFLSGYAMYLGKDLAALGTLFATIISTGGIFIYSKHSDKQERLEKEKMVRKRK